MPNLKVICHPTYMKFHHTVNSTQNVNFRAHLYFINHQGGKMLLFKPWHDAIMIILYNTQIDNISPSLLWNDFIYSKELFCHMTYPFKRSPFPLRLIIDFVISLSKVGHRESGRDFQCDRTMPTQGPLTPIRVCPHHRWWHHPLCLSLGE